MSCFRRLYAVFHNLYVGLWVLLSQLYWLAGPDFAFRRQHRSRLKAMAGCRARLEKDNDMHIRTELDVLEAEDAAATAHYAAKRSYFLEAVRKRCGIE